MDGVPSVTQPVGVGLGQQLPFFGTSPAAGANYSTKMDGYGFRRLLTLCFTLVTDGTAASRLVTVEYQGSDGNPYSINEATTLVAASSTERFAGSVWKTVSDFNTGTDLLFNLDCCLLSPGDTLVIAVASAQAGDQLSKIRGAYERFPLNPDVLPNLEP